MLLQLRDDLARRGIELTLAHGVGQVRDVLHTAGGGDTTPLFETVRDAVAAVQAQHESHRPDEPTST